MSDSTEVMGVVKEKKRVKGETDAKYMQQQYWAVIHECQKKFKKEFPDKSGREILAMARAEFLGLDWNLS